MSPMLLVIPILVVFGCFIMSMVRLNQALQTARRLYGSTLPIAWQVFTVLLSIASVIILLFAFWQLGLQTYSGDAGIKTLTGP